MDASHQEHDPYERIVLRARGLQALGIIAGMAHEHTDTVSPQVWGQLWHFVVQTVGDIERDAARLGQ